MYMDSSSTIDSSSVDEHYPISTRVNELWCLINGENSSYKKLDELMESLAKMLLRHKEKGEPPFWPIQRAEVEKLVKTTVKLIGASDNSRTTCKHQILAARLLIPLADELLHCDQTKLVYSVLVEALRAAIANEQYSTLLIGSLSHGLSQLNYKHVITKEEAADLMKQLIPVAGIAFYKDTSNLSHQERYDLVWKKCFHQYYTFADSAGVNWNYKGLIICLYSLANYYGLDEYYEYAKSVFQYAELKGVVNSEVLVVLNVLMIVNGESTVFEKYGDDFLEELAQITMRLMCFSSDYIRGHLIYLILAQLCDIEAMFNPFDRYDMSVGLVDHFLTRHNDPVADLFVLRMLQTNGKMFRDISRVYEGKRDAIRDKLNQLEINEEFRKEFRLPFN